MTRDVRKGANGDWFRELNECLEQTQRPFIMTRSASLVRCPIIRCSDCATAASTFATSSPSASRGRDRGRGPRC